MTYDFRRAVQSGHPALDTWDTTINEWCAAFNCAPSLVKAHMEYESDGDPNAVGSSGRGLGLMQIDYGTWKDQNGAWRYSSQYGTTLPGEIFQPDVNVKIACRDFISANMAAFPNDINAAIAAYNAGIDPVREALATGVDLTTVTFRPWYVPTVRAAYDWFVANAPA